MKIYKSDSGDGGAGKANSETKHIFDNEKEVSQESNFLAGTVNFTIKYKDTYYNDYEQDYMFQYSAVSGIGRVKSELPRLIE